MNSALNIFKKEVKKQLDKKSPIEFEGRIITQEFLEFVFSNCEFSLALNLGNYIMDYKIAAGRRKKYGYNLRQIS